MSVLCTERDMVLQEQPQGWRLAVYMADEAAGVCMMLPGLHRTQRLPPPSAHQGFQGCTYIELLQGRDSPPLALLHVEWFVH